jgi:hypothetical protein
VLKPIRMVVLEPPPDGSKLARRAGRQGALLTRASRGRPAGRAAR